MTVPRIVLPRMPLMARSIARDPSRVGAAAQRIVWHPFMAAPV
jgi:hypothetical protein